MDQKITDDTIKDCKMNFLQHEYYRYSNFIYNQTQHIERLYKENIITINIRNNCLRQLSDLIRFMNNDVYNMKLKEINNEFQEKSNKDNIKKEDYGIEDNEFTEYDIDENGKDIIENKTRDLKKSDNEGSKKEILYDKGLCDIINN